jgi:hypothetical protein
LQDEIYFIVRGQGVLCHDGKRDRFESGDLPFVAAGIEHQIDLPTPAIRNLIMSKFGWWNLWLLAGPVVVTFGMSLASAVRIGVVISQ